jgi:rubrerythrin
VQLDKLQDIIAFAISKEEEAIAFYQDLADKADSEAMKTELLKIKGMEERHRERLMNFSIGDMLTDPWQVQDLGISKYVVETVPGPDMTFKDIINIAMHRENAAMDLYLDLAKLVNDDMARRMFETLASEEKAHKLYFETLWDTGVLQEN